MGLDVGLRVCMTVSAVPTQYAYPAQKLVLQSLGTAGFHARNWAEVIKNWFSTELHESPDCTVYHLMQLEGCPERVGAVGEDAVLVVGEAVVRVEDAFRST